MAFFQFYLKCLCATQESKTVVTLKLTCPLYIWHWRTCTEFRRFVGMSQVAEIYQRNPEGDVFNTSVQSFFTTDVTFIHPNKYPSCNYDLNLGQNSSFLSNILVSFIEPRNTRIRIQLFGYYPKLCMLLKVFSKLLCFLPVYRPD